MYVEDYLIAIADKLTLRPAWRRKLTATFGGMFDDSWHQNFISSVARHIRDDHPLSSNQSRMILKLIAQARSYLVDYGLASPAEVDDLLARPQHRKTPYESTQTPHEVRYLGDNLLGLRCKADPIITGTIKTFGHAAVPRSRPRFDWTYKIWIVPVCDFNVQAIRSLLRKHRFREDRATIAYLAQCEAGIEQPAQFTFADADQTIMIVNVANDVLLANWIIDTAGGIVL